MAAKAVDIEVQRFSIGLGPKLWGVQRGETEYVISAIPLGGYVKMGGMDDEIMEAVEGGEVEGDENREPGPRDFDAKPIWARTLVISAGVIMNMVFAFAAYTAVAAGWGLAEVETTRVGGVEETLLPPGTDGLLAIPVGSEIVRVGDREVEHWGDVREAIVGADPGIVSIRTRGPEGAWEVRVPTSDEERRRLAAALSPWVAPAVGAVEPGTPAARAGLEVGDRILTVDGRPVETWSEFVDEIQARAGERTALLVERDGREITRVVTPEAAEEEVPATGEIRTVGRIGILRAPPDVIYEPVGVVEAVQVGYRETVAVTGLILGFLGDLVTGGVSPRSVGSIVTIGEVSGQAAEAGIVQFLQFMALFSVNLAILNLLPIPILDGGHLVFLGIEAVRGQALSVEQRMRWSQVGFIVIMGIMLWALSNDFLRLFGL